MTGLIYIVIIALWVAVLVPMWLRRHDQISEVRSTARFSHSMRRLAAMDVHPAGANRADRATKGVGGMSARNVHQEAAKRRALVLAALSGVLAVTLVAALLSVLPMWLPLLSALLVVGFMVATAMTASQRSASSATVRTRSTQRPAAPAVAPRATDQSEAEWLAWNAWDDEDSWEAVPATLPTYVSAPRATAVPRPIDKRRGEWSGEAMVDAAQAMRRRVEETSVETVDHHAQTAEIPVVRVQPALAVNE